MSNDNKEGAGVPVAYLLTRPSGFAWPLMPKDITPETRAVFEADGARVEPLFLATPPAVMPAAPSDAAALLRLAKKHGAYITGDNPGDTATFRPHELVAFAAALSQTMQPQAGAASAKSVSDMLLEAGAIWGGIRGKWSATPAQINAFVEILNRATSQAEPAAGEQAGAVADDSVARLNGAVAGLQAAVIFLDQMRKAAKDGEDVTGTGAARDAREWLESAARALLETLSAPPAAPGAAIAAREQEDKS